MAAGSDVGVRLAKGTSLKRAVVLNAPESHHIVARGDAVTVDTVRHTTTGA